MMFEPIRKEASSESAEVLIHPPVQTLMDGEQALLAGYHCVKFLEALWIVFILEFAVQYLLRDRSQPFWRTHVSGLVTCLCPALRLCARHPDMGGKIWLPGLGWRRANAALRGRLERLFSVPMIFIALGILPVLLIEFGMRQQVLSHRWLQLALHLSLGIIWFAFATEFIVMFSVADKRWRYCKEHWIDIAIILLPFISFLRSLRIVRAMRVARLARVEQLVRMSRLYRLRGLAMRALRACCCSNCCIGCFGSPRRSSCGGCGRNCARKKPTCGFSNGRLPNWNVRLRRSGPPRSRSVMAYPDVPHLRLSCRHFSQTSAVVTLWCGWPFAVLTTETVVP